MTPPLHPAEEAATPTRCSPRTGEDARPVTESHGNGRHLRGNATSRRRKVSTSKRICARSETTHPGESIGAVKPGLGLHAARAEFVRLQAMGEFSAREPAWPDAAKPAPCYLLIGGAIVLPLLPQEGGWVATTCVTQR